MSYGIAIYTPSGQVCFDSSKLGGVALDSFSLAMTANTNYTYNYTIPSGSTVETSITPRNVAFRSDLLTITKTIVGTSASITINPGNASYTAIITFILV